MEILNHPRNYFRILLKNNPMHYHHAHNSIQPEMQETNFYKLYSFFQRIDNLDAAPSFSSSLLTSTRLILNTIMWILYAIFKFLTVVILIALILFTLAMVAIYLYHERNGTRRNYSADTLPILLNQPNANIAS